MNDPHSPPTGLNSSSSQVLPEYQARREFSTYRIVDRICNAIESKKKQEDISAVEPLHIRLKRISTAKLIADSTCGTSYDYDGIYDDGINTNVAVVTNDASKYQPLGGFIPFILQS